MNVASTRDQEIFDAYFGGETIRSLAERHGLSYQRIQQIIRQGRGLPPYPAQRSTEEDPMRWHLWDVHLWRESPHARPEGWTRIQKPTLWHAFEHEHEANWGERHSHGEDGLSIEPEGSTA